MEQARKKGAEFLARTAHSEGWGRRIFFRIERARETSYSFTLYKSQLTRNAWWQGPGSLSMNPLGWGRNPVGAEGGRDWGEEAVGTGSGFQGKQETAHKDYFCLHYVCSELNHSCFWEKNLKLPRRENGHGFRATKYKPSMKPGFVLADFPTQAEATQMSTSPEAHARKKKEV